MRNTPIKVLFVTTTRFGLDGVSTVILNYFRAIDKSDIKIDLVVPNDVKQEIKDEFIRYSSHIYKIDGRLSKPYSYTKRLIKLVSENGYDIVHAHGNSATLLFEMYAAKKGGAAVRIPHSHNTTCRYKLVDKLLRPLFYRSYTHAFACGEAAGRWLYGNRSFTVINNGIDIDRFLYNPDKRKEYRDRYGLCGNKVVGHIGHFSFQKNHEFLIDIFAELYSKDNTYRLMLIGDGALRADIEKKVQNLGLSDAVMFMGRTNEVPQLLQAIDVLVMPSRFEGLPLTLIEAQTACLPCIVSDAVSKEVAITELITFASLNDIPKKWADMILSVPLTDREKKKDMITQKIIDTGYSIRDKARWLKDMYIGYLATAKAAKQTGVISK